MLIKVVDVTMHNKTCFGSFNVKQTLGEREREVQEYRLTRRLHARGPIHTHTHAPASPLMYIDDTVREYACKTSK